ncbi:predicted protein [Scheffersomyces stipitis CBS 6054]|uniref:Uncharacterized protein n=1 Tax=Scheffersomyces stipitis (strain ATCC 58785 / CBS 6054 / NBRC 10063 / NRRL Y-11545) TaxID=322104 RepID=A3LRJ0_PICST|nr:predicted protein [Scheffersomyces stipitis CBS 6054]ABN65744.2 predicted protein [Scheffersomyces stipitis CBS 6054]
MRGKYGKRYLVVPLLLILFLVFTSHSHHQKFANFTASLATHKSTIKEPYVKNIFVDEEFNYTKVEYVSNNQRSNGNIPVKNSPFDDRKTRPTVLIVSTIASNSGYGEGRTFVDFFDTISTLYQHDTHDISLAFLINSASEFSKVETIFNTNSSIYENPALRKVTLLSAPFLEENSGFSRDQRHNDNVQRLRRRLIARARNFVLYTALHQEQYTLFLDADIIKLDHSDKVISTFINSKKDIIVPRIIRDGNQDYDKNSWRGQRTKPDENQLEKMDDDRWEQWDYVPRDVPGKMYHFQNYVDNKNNEREQHLHEFEYAVPLDSVGGAVLFAKSVIYKQGVVFPTNYIIGTSWDRSEGYDGIETEGVCYIAKPLGYLCWGYPNILAYHSSN